MRPAGTASHTPAQRRVPALGQTRACRTGAQRNSDGDRS